MKNYVVLCALAGISSSVLAQSASLTIVPSFSTLDWTTQTTMTLSVYGDADFGTHIAGGAFGIQVTGGESTIVDMVGSAAIWGQQGEDDFGYEGDGSYAGLVYGQVIFLPFLLPDPESALANGPVLLGTIEVEYSTGFLGSAHFAVVDPETDFVMQVFDELNDDDGGLPGTYTELQASDINFGSASVQIVPSPNALTAIGVMGMMATRRRR